MFSSVGSFNSSIVNKSISGTQAPTNLLVTSTTSSSVTISFTPPLNTIATYLATTNTGSQGSNTTSPVTINGLISSTTYTATIVSINNSGVTSGPSNSITFTTNVGQIGTGGTTTYNGTSFIHIFTSNGTFVASQSGTIYIFLVAGGGGGGGDTGGGGGAGGVIYYNSYSISQGSYTIIIGQGGAASTGLTTNGTNGGNTTFGVLLTAIGGGGGGGARNTNALLQGGSGGGGSAVSGYVSVTGGLGTSGQGNNGGLGGDSSSSYGSGGGGAFAVGGRYISSSGTTSAAGGAGITLSGISGNNYYLPGFTSITNTSGTTGIVSFGGGGGGGSWNNTSQALGGLGGGGAGVGNSTNTVSPNGISNTGGGGGGGGSAGINAGSGGSGIVIISYLGSSSSGPVNVGIPTQPTVTSIVATLTTLTINFSTPNNVTTGSTYSLFYGSIIYGTATYPATSITVTNLIPNTTYQFKITATNSVATSIATTTITGLTLPLYPIYNLLSSTSNSVIMNLTNTGNSVSVSNTLSILPSSGSTSIIKLGSKYTINGLVSNKIYLISNITQNPSGSTNNLLGQFTNTSAITQIASGMNLPAINYYGQYICVGCTGNGIYVSSNSGGTYNKIITDVSAGKATISDSGKYMYVVSNNTNKIYISANYGASFNSVNVGSKINSISCSTTGSIIYLTDLSNNGIYYSQNYGSSWSNIITVAANLNNIKTNISGSIAYFTSTSTGMAYSYNLYNNTITIYSPGGNSNVSGIATSSDGGYIYISNYGGFCYTSNDTGVSFTQVSSTYLPTSNYSNITCDSTGQYVYVHNFTTSLYYSIDYGITFNYITYPSTINSIFMNSNNAFLGITSSSGIYISSNSLLYDNTLSTNISITNGGFNNPSQTTNAVTYYFNNNFLKTSGYNYSIIPGWTINYYNMAIAIGNGSNSFFNASIPGNSNQAIIFQINGNYPTIPYSTLSQQINITTIGNYNLNFYTIPKAINDLSYISLTAYIGDSTTSTTLLSTTSSWNKVILPFTISTIGNYYLNYYLTMNSNYINTNVNSSIALTNISISQAFNPPTNLTLTNINTTSAILNFLDASTSSIYPTSYTSNYGSGSGTSSAYTISGLISNTPYNISLIANYASGYYLTGTSPSGSSTPSSVISVLTLPTPPSLSVLNIGTTTVTLNIVNTGSGTISGYNLTTSPVGGIGTISGTSYIISGLSSNTRYNISISSINSSGVSGASFISITTYPNALIDVSATVLSDTWVSVNFTPCSGTESINYLATSNPNNVTANGTTPPIIVKYLTSDISYNFTVTATNSQGTSAISNISNTVTTNSIPNTPSNLAVINNNNPISASVAFDIPIGSITSYIAVARLAP